MVKTKTAGSMIGCEGLAAASNEMGIERNAGQFEHYSYPDKPRSDRWLEGQD